MTTSSRFSRSLLPTISKCNHTVTKSPTPKINWRLLRYYYPTSNNTIYQPKAPGPSARLNPQFIYQTRTMASESSAERASDSASDPASNPVSEGAPGQSAQSKLPPLSDHEFRQYNRLAEHMNLFHNHFRSTWNMLWGACTNGRRPAGMSLNAFVNAGLQFVQGLEMHHGIEESYVFPVLAKKMPEFRSGSGKGHNGAAELLRQHKEIHKGLDKLQDYLRRCKSGETELEMAVLKSKMEDWGTVLWTHLDQEVETLGAENMRRYWTLDEMRRLQM